MRHMIISDEAIFSHTAMVNRSPASLNQSLNRNFFNVAKIAIAITKSTVT